MRLCYTCFIHTYIFTCIIETEFGWLVGECASLFPLSNFFWISWLVAIGYIGCVLILNAPHCLRMLTFTLSSFDLWWNGKCHLEIKLFVSKIINIILTIIIIIWLSSNLFVFNVFQSLSIFRHIFMKLIFDMK